MDKGKQNATRSIVAAVSNEMREQQGAMRNIVEFVTEELPNIIEEAQPVSITSCEASRPVISPHDFSVRDFVSEDDREEVFGNAGDLVEALDVERLSTSVHGSELIGIDESKVDTPLPQSALSLLRTVAFRMYKNAEGDLHEAAGPIVNEMRMRLRDDASFANKNELIGYIRNNFVAYTSALMSKAYERDPFVVLHGPLVRAIGGFSRIEFDYSTAKQLLAIDLGEAGEIETPTSGDVIEGDEHTRANMPLNPEDAFDGHENLRQFNNFCGTCQQCKVGQGAFSRQARPRHGEGEEPSEEDITNRKYPGLCLYFWILRSLFDLARLGSFDVVSVVERINRATEKTHLLLPSLLSKADVSRQVDESSAQSILDQLNISFDGKSGLPLYQAAHDAIEELNLADSNIFTHLLSEGQYTAPLPIRRYQTHGDNNRELGIQNWGLDNGPGGAHRNILNTIFPPANNGNPIRNGRYRVMMSYLRSTPLREPVRVEYFDLPHQSDPEEVIGPVYLMSIPYQEYGLPLILYYADKLAHTPKQLVRTVVERQYLELTFQDQDDPVKAQRLLGRLSRNYFQREGLQ